MIETYAWLREAERSLNRIVTEYLVSEVEHEFRGTAAAPMYSVSGHSGISDGLDIQASIIATSK